MDMTFQSLFLGQPLWMWASFVSVVAVLLIADLGIFNKKDHVIGIKESLVTSAVYISIGLLFGVWILYEYDPNLNTVCAPNCHVQAASEYWTGFIVEKTLSMDNVFVISLIFSFFAIPPKYQHRVLFWGILGVLILRGIMIGLGTKLVSEFHWVLYIFAAFLIITGFKMLISEDEEMNVEDNAMLKILRKYLPITDELHGNRFFIKQKSPETGKMVQYCTPLFVTLLMIEFVDLIFAVDSVPAVFAITLDPFIVYTSNIFAILGLRALYFALSAVIDRFSYLKPALAIVLMFIGSKIFIVWAMGWEKFPTSWSLGITLGLIATGIIYSLYKTRDGVTK